jgi:hypothetical protein
VLVEKWGGNQEVEVDCGADGYCTLKRYVLIMPISISM